MNTLLQTSRRPVGRAMHVLIAVCLLLGIGGFALGETGEAYAVSSITRSATPTDIAIGDVIDYSVTIVIDADEQPFSPRIQDSFVGAGFEYLSGSASLEYTGAWWILPAFATTSEPVRDDSAPGTPTLTWQLNDFYNTPYEANSLTLHYQIRYTGERPDGTREFFVPAAADQLQSHSTLWWEPVENDPETSIASNSTSVGIDQPLLTLTKSALPGPDFAPGELIEFRTVVTNSGWAPAYNLVVDETPDPAIPVSGVTMWDSVGYISPTDIAFSSAGGTYTFDFLDRPLAVGHSLYIQFWGRVPSSATPPTTYMHSADVDWSTQPASVPGERVCDDADWEDVGAGYTADSDSANIPVVDAPYILLTKEIRDGAPPYAPLGSQVTWDITLTNVGSMAAPAVGLLDEFAPGYLGFSSASIAPDSSTPAGTLTWNDITDGEGLAVGESITLQVTLNALAVTPAGQWVFNSAGVFDPNAPEPNGAAQGGAAPVLQAQFGDTDRSYIQIYDPADVVFSKTATDLNGGRLVPGDEIEWTITIENTSLSPITNIVITDSAPVNTTYVAGSITGTGADDTSAPNLLWNIGTLAPGSSETVAFRTTVDAGVPSGTIISNQARFSSDNRLVTLSDEPSTPPIGDATLLATGGDEIALLVLGLLVVAAGLVLALRARRLLGNRQEPTD